MSQAKDETRNSMSSVSLWPCLPGARFYPWFLHVFTNHFLGQGLQLSLCQRSLWPATKQLAWFYSHMWALQPSSGPAQWRRPWNFQGPHFIASRDWFGGCMFSFAMLTLLSSFTWSWQKIQGVQAIPIILAPCETFSLFLVGSGCQKSSSNAKGRRNFQASPCCKLFQKQDDWMCDPCHVTYFFYEQIWGN